MNYEQKYFRRIIDKETHEFIRDADLNYDVLEENEVAIYAESPRGLQKPKWSYTLNRWIEGS
ncbi:MAG: hypothetical protein GX132_01415 [Erysipelotrichia bacterium]|nr:hypothetical protein [Erysipelotrichia bacterium]